LPESLAWTAVSGIGPAPPWGPQIAVSANGDTLLVFATDVGIWAQRLERASNRFTPPLRISGDRYSETVGPRVAMDDQGDAVVAWSVGDGDVARAAVIARRFAATGGWPSGWGPKETVTAGDSPYLTRLSMTASGHAAASWMRGSQAAAVAVSEWGRGWQPPAGVPCDDPSVLTIDSGVVDDGRTLRVIAAGIASTAAHHAYVVGAVYRYDLDAHAGAFGAPAAPLDDGGIEQAATAIGTDGEGNAVLGIFERISGDERLGAPNAGKVYAVRHDGAWGTPQLVYDGPGRDPTLFVSRGGAAAMVLNDFQSGSSQTHVRRYLDGAWQPAIAFPTDAFASRSGSFALDGHGDMFAFFAVPADDPQGPGVAIARFGAGPEWSARQRLPFAPADDLVARLLMIGSNGPAIAVAQNGAGSTSWQSVRTGPSTFQP